MNILENKSSLVVLIDICLILNRTILEEHGGACTGDRLAILVTSFHRERVRAYAALY